ncbi:MAG TPA: hypothetical protein VNQ90_04255 [Chthoniobacteraceae bacterium]|nr:hypothetical protein [Chthoniobacteraceae bacterium]
MTPTIEPVPRPAAPPSPRPPESTRSGPRWIWCDASPAAGSDRHAWVWARRVFECAVPREALLEITADLRYDLWVNGERIGFGPPRYHVSTPTVDRYRLAAHLRSGRNVIAVRVYSLGKVAISSCMPRRGGLWCRLSLGEHQLVSDRRWKMWRDPAYAALTARRGDVQPPNECYDARERPGEVMAADFDDSGWPFACELEEPSGPTLPEPRDIPFFPVQAHLPDRVLQVGWLRTARPYPQIALGELAESLRAASDAPLPGDGGQPGRGSGGCVRSLATAYGSRESFYAVWDLGRLWTGYPVAHLSGPAGTIVDLCYGEHLSGGRVDPAKARLNYFDRVILGDAPFSHRVTWPKCARYVQAVVHGGAAEIRLEWERSAFPVERRGFFASSSPVLDHAVELSLHTVELCMEDSYLDTPWRERGAWLGDDLIKARAAYAYFGDYSLARRFLLHHARGQRSDGQMQGKYPGNITSHVSTWTLAYPPSLLEYSIESGDWGLARDLWENLVRLVGWLEAKFNAGGLLEAPPTEVSAHVNRYNFIDWAPIDLRGANAAWNAFGCHALLCSARIASALGRAAEAGRWNRLAEGLRDRFRACFWDGERGVFVNGVVEGRRTARWGCHENILALLYGLADADQQERIFERLQREDLRKIFVADENDYDAELPGLGKIPTVSLALSRYRWPEEKMVPLGTPYFAMYWLEALCRAGKMAEAQRFIEARWGELARQGATSVWETWDQRQSLSHAWSCSPAVICARYFAGVRRLDDSGRRYAVLPAPGLLTRLRCRVATRFGVIQVLHGEAGLEVDVPAGLEVCAGLPPETGPGLLLLNGVPVPSPETVSEGAARYLCAPLRPGKNLLNLQPNQSHP